VPSAAKKETFEKCSILFKVKEGENIALTLHFVQPQVPRTKCPCGAYIEYSADETLSLSKRSVDPAHRGRRDWTKGGVFQRSQKKPGSRQWEATFTRTNRRFTTQANEITSIVFRVPIRFPKPSTKNKKSYQDFFKI